MTIIYSLKCIVPFSFVVPLLSLVLTHCHLLAFVVTRHITRCHFLSLVVPVFVTRCHSLSFVITRCHSLYHSLPLVVIRRHSSYQSLSLVVIRCHWLYHLFSLVVICCHSLHHLLPLVVIRCTTRLSFCKRSYNPPILKTYMCNETIVQKFYVKRKWNVLIKWTLIRSPAACQDNKMF